MSSLGDWFDPNSPSGIFAIIFGAATVLAMANQQPGLLALLSILAFFGWAGVRSGRLDGGGTDGPSDPMTILQQRYASGEISQVEFEERVDRLLAVDARAKGQIEQDREPATERSR